MLSCLERNQSDKFILKNDSQMTNKNTKRGAHVNKKKKKTKIKHLSCFLI